MMVMLRLLVVLRLLLLLKLLLLLLLPLCVQLARQCKAKSASHTVFSQHQRSE